MELLELSLLMLATVLLSSVIDQLVPKVSSPLIQIGLGLAIARRLSEQQGGSLQGKLQDGRLILTLSFPVEEDLHN